MARKPLGKMLSSVVENIPDAVVGIDKEGKILVLNPQAGSLFNVNAEKSVGKKIWDIMEINDFTRIFVSLVKESEPSPLEQFITIPLDRIYLVKMTPVYDNEDRVMGAIAILQDFTDLHKMEKTLNEFVAHVSHELKTPLTSIKGFVETLLEGAMTNPKITKKFLQIINEETNRMTRLVVELLDITRMTHTNNVRETFKPVNPRDLLINTAKFFEPLAREKNLELTTHIPDNLPTIPANEDKLRQVLLNLVDNAVKYTGIDRPGGKIEVKAVKNGETVKIEVSDTGVGIPPEEQSKIFDKFYRIQQGPSAELGGTGLGLSIVKTIVEAHGGNISVKSNPERGSTFSVVLPVWEKGGKPQ